MKYTPISVTIPDSHGDTLDLSAWEARRLITSLRRALDKWAKRKRAKASAKVRAKNSKPVRPRTEDTPE